MPTIEPMSATMKAAVSPISSAERAPQTSCEKRSRPRLVVPMRKPSSPGRRSAASAKSEVKRISVGSCVAIQGAKTAMTMKTA